MSFRDIGKKIQMAREEKGMSQEQLARALGCSQSALSNYEKGKRRLYLSHLEILAQILERPLEYFMESDETGASKKINNDWGLYPNLINTIYHLTDIQLQEVQKFIEYIKWKDSRGG